MGHSGDNNEKVYQVPPAIREIIQIGKRLDSIDKGETSYFKLTLFCEAAFEHNVSI